MRLGKLDLNLLVALDHMLELRSITQTANRMYLTQSAMSSALRRLREFFDDPLLVQVGREMELTPRAQALKKPLRDILIQIDSALAAGLSFEAATSTRQFRIIISDYTMTIFIPHLLALAQEEGAAVRFSFLHQVRAPHEVIEQGEADLLITPSVFISEDHPSETIFSDDFVAVAWAQGRYGSGALDFDRYIDAGHVVMTPPVDIKSFQTDFMSKMGIHRKFEVECYSLAALVPLVVGTHRIATVHGHLARLLEKLYPVVIHRLPFETPRIDENLQWHRHMTADPGILWLRGLAQRAAGRMTGG